MENRVLIYAEALDVAAEGAVWYARRIGGGTFAALHVPGKKHRHRHPRALVRLHGRRAAARRAAAGHRRRPQRCSARSRGSAASGDDVVVTVVLPEQFRKRSLLAAAQRAQFRLKLRLLVEPGVVVADVPAVTSERRPEGRVPDRLVVRVLAGAARRRDAPRGRATPAGLGRRRRARRALRRARLGRRASSGSPSTTRRSTGRLGDSILTYVRQLTADPASPSTSSCPSGSHESLRRLRGRRALAIKRCLLFEPHVILSSVPYPRRRFRRVPTAPPSEPRPRARPRRARPLRDRLRQRRLVDLLRARPHRRHRARAHAARLHHQRPDLRGDRRNLRGGHRSLPGGGRLVELRAPRVQRARLVRGGVGADAELRDHRRDLGDLRPALPLDLLGAAAHEPVGHRRRHRAHLAARRHQHRRDPGGGEAEHPARGRSTSRRSCCSSRSASS